MISFRQADLLETLRPKYIIEIFPLTDKKKVYLGESDTALEYRPEGHTQGRWGIPKENIYATWDRGGNLIVLMKHMHEELQRKNLRLLNKEDVVSYEDFGRVASIKNGIIETAQHQILRPEDYRWYGHDGDHVFITEA
jgi:hypothetical protein